MLIDLMSSFYSLTQNIKDRKLSGSGSISSDEEEPCDPKEGRTNDVSPPGSTPAANPIANPTDDTPASLDNPTDDTPASTPPGFNDDGLIGDPTYDINWDLITRE